MCVCVYVCIHRHPYNVNSFLWSYYSEGIKEGYDYFERDIQARVPKILINTKTQRYNVWLCCGLLLSDVPCSTVSWNTVVEHCGEFEVIFSLQWLVRLYCLHTKETHQVQLRIYSKRFRNCSSFMSMEIHNAQCGKARQLYLYSTFHTRGRLKVLHITGMRVYIVMGSHKRLPALLSQRGQRMKLPLHLVAVFLWDAGRPTKRHKC